MIWLKSIRDEAAMYLLSDLWKKFSLNQDGRLTKAEIVEKYDLFVGSQATDFGEALTRHDEF